MAITDFISLIQCLEQMARALSLRGCASLGSDFLCAWGQIVPLYLVDGFRKCD